MRRFITRVAWTVVATVAVSQQVNAQFELLSEVGTSSKNTKQLYPVTEKQGPVMVKVASFIGRYVNPKGEVYANGLEIANALAKELREEHGIEAYTFLFQDHLSRRRTADEKEEFDRQLELFEKKFRVRPRIAKLRTPPPENWVVLAGNFDGFDDRSAQRFLEKIRKINPKCVSGDVRRHLRFIKAGDAGPADPLGNAILVRNPLVAKAAVVVDSGHEELLKMLLELNDGERYSLYQNRARGTIEVVQYRGVAVVGDKEAKGIFSRNKIKEDKAILQDSAKKAIVMCEKLRSQGLEAYVFHGKFASLVTVGGYAGPHDPRVRQDMQKLADMKVAGVQLKPRLIPVPRHPASIQSIGQTAN